MSRNSSVFLASSSEISASCSFSPGRIPITSTSQPGATVSARLTSFMLGIFGTKISPPCITSILFTTKRTPCSRVIQNLVIRASVIVIFPFFLCSTNTGITLPRLPTTFPYLAQLNRVAFDPAYAFACTNIFSAHSFVAPYKLTGLTALSVLKATTRLTPQSIAASITLRPPIILVWIASNVLYSHAGTCFSAAACTTTVTPSNARTSRCGSRTSPINHRRLGWSNPSARISCCFNSSRLRMTSFLGRYSRSIISTNLCPNDPVPPVTNTTCSDQFILILNCAAETQPRQPLRLRPLMNSQVYTSQIP